MKECQGVSNVRWTAGGATKTQFYIGDVDSAGTKNSVKLDLTMRFNHGDFECMYHINSVKPNAAGEPNSGEARSIRRMHENINKIVNRLAEAKARNMKNAEDIAGTGYSYDSIPKPKSGDDAEINRIIEDFMKNVFSCATTTRNCVRSQSIKG